MINIPVHVPSGLQKGSTKSIGWARYLVAFYLSWHRGDSGGIHWKKSNNNVNDRTLSQLNPCFRRRSRPKAH